MIKVSIQLKNFIVCIEHYWESFWNHFGDELQHGLFESAVQLGPYCQFGVYFVCGFSDNGLCGFVQDLIEGFKVCTVFFGVGVFTRIHTQELRVVEFLWYLQDTIEVMEDMLGFLPVSFLDILLIHLNNIGEPINDKLLEEWTLDYRIILRLNQYRLKRRQILQFGYLQQRTNEITSELHDLQFPV